MSDSNKLRAGEARAENNLDATPADATPAAENRTEALSPAELEALREAELDAFFGNLDEQLSQAKEADLAAKLMKEPDANDIDPNTLPDHIRDLHELGLCEGDGFYRHTTEDEHAARAPKGFDRQEDVTFALITPRSGGGLRRSYWCASKDTFKALEKMGKAPPEAHRLLGRFYPCRRL